MLYLILFDFPSYLPHKEGNGTPRSFGAGSSAVAYLNHVLFNVFSLFGPSGKFDRCKTWSSTCPGAVSNYLDELYLLDFGHDFVKRPHKRLRMMLTEKN